MKAGTASFSTVQSVYNGKKAYRGSLITRGSDKVDQMFVLRDTLLCYNTLDLTPLYFRKGAHEGSRYTVDEVFYTYPNGKCSIRQHRQHNDGSHTWNKHTYDDSDGDGTQPARLRYEGKTNIKADNGHTYRCLKLAYMESKDGGEYKKIVDFYVTDDANHVPVRLDMHLKFGAAKAFLSNMKGVKEAITSLVK